MKKLLILLIALVLVLSGCGAEDESSGDANTPEPADVSSAAPSEEPDSGSPEPTPDPLAEAGRFQTEFFSFDYPMQWTARTEADYFYFYPTSDEDVSAFSVNLVENDVGFEYMELALSYMSEEDLVEMMNSMGGEDFSAGEVAVESITVGGKPVLLMSAADSIEPDKTLKVYIFLTDTHQITLYWSGGGQYEMELETLLSSVDF
ncbi:MAG: hypothetical protein Q4C01_05360 [Clostridia bacterium]|nr:hypothetical protein [Clostridia bacterium]